MTDTEREDKLRFIFETGKLFRFYMDETVLKSGIPDKCPCGDLTGIQMNAAIKVCMHQPLSLNELAERLGVSAPSASVMADKLVEKRVLVREPDPSDRRRVILRIHPEVQPDMDALNQRFNHAFDRVARRVGDENILLWYKVMTQVQQLLAEENA